MPGCGAGAKDNVIPSSAEFLRCWQIPAVPGDPPRAIATLSFPLSAYAGTLANSPPEVSKPRCRCGSDCPGRTDPTTTTYLSLKHQSSTRAYHRNQKTRRQLCSQALWDRVRAGGGYFKT